MGRIAGGVLGLVAGASVVVLGLAEGAPWGRSAWRGVAAAVLGYVIGRLAFGGRGDAGASPGDPPEKAS